MKGWAFYNSDGELVGGFDGAWKFYNASGELLADLSGAVVIDHDDLTNVTADQHHTEDHASRHEDGGADELEIADLATSEVDTEKVLQPDGSGGVQWQDFSGGGRFEPLTNGIVADPELIFADGDVIMVEIP
jgi:hypothetical protein